MEIQCIQMHINAQRALKKMEYCKRKNLSWEEHWDSYCDCGFQERDYYENNYEPYDPKLVVSLKKELIKKRIQLKKEEDAIQAAQDKEWP